MGLYLQKISLLSPRCFGKIEKKQLFIDAADKRLTGDLAPLVFLSRS